jgi:3-methyl-2-oxobutanoate hydroxymethyltransferase
VQAKTAEASQRLLDDALALQDAGCFAIVLEAVPMLVAETVSKKLEIPTIGIGAGVGCDGQVLVYNDMLGLFDRFTPKFVKQYANLRPQILSALQSYREEVELRTFPTETHSFKIDEKEMELFLYGGNLS